MIRFHLSAFYNITNGNRKLRLARVGSWFGCNAAILATPVPAGSRGYGLN